LTNTLEATTICEINLLRNRFEEVKHKTTKEVSAIRHNNDK